MGRDRVPLGRGTRCLWLGVQRGQHEAEGSASGLGAAGFKDRDRKGLQARGLGRELEAGGGTRAGGRHSEMSDHSSLPPSCR